MTSATQTEDNSAAPQEIYEYSALCPAGFEATLADELRSLGCIRIRPLQGSVAFGGTLRDGYRTCLWSRLASRILLVIARVDAADADELYRSCRDSIAWEEHIGPLATFAIDGRGGNDELHDRRFIALRVKDAVCDRLRDVRGSRPYVDTETPDVLISCTLHQRRATIAIDLGGSSLLDHGYRMPARSKRNADRARFVREDMAALILTLGGWTKTCSHADDAQLVDPLGTSSHLVLEAACIAADRAPRLTRRRWGFSGWAGHDEALWAEELACAQQRFDVGRTQARRVTVASTDADRRGEITEMARRCGLSETIRIEACGPGVLDLGERPLPYALVAFALPSSDMYGESGDLPARLASVAALTRSAALAEAPVVALTTGDMLSGVLGFEPDICATVINGNTDANIFVYPSFAQAARRGGSSDAPEGTLQPEITLPDGTAMSVLMASSEQFAARLARMARHRGKWARRSGITCYRIYDADMPDYALSIDLYEGASATPGRWLVMSEYAPPRSVDAALAARRLSDALAIAPRVLGVDPDNVVLKVRRRAKGGSQYGPLEGDHRTALVEEGGLIFEVNFTDYLDTGLFLDHRLVRSMIRDKARGVRFLNLFAYTGTATVYAAGGGAIQTTSVDLSKTYLAWAERNLEQNGFSGPDHECIQADVMPWITEQRHTAHRWGLIYIDPPTFSNSARMGHHDFDVQQDHAELLIGASRLLARGGTIIFSCNLRGFVPDVDKLERAGVEIEDITARTIPEDFERNAKIHHCYLVRRSG